jgi:hypothetical protein
MLIDVTEILTDLVARNRGPDPLNPDTPRKPDYGIEASLQGNVLSVVLTFRRGSAYCCMEHGCHLALTDGRRWDDLRARLASRQIIVSACLELRLSCVVEEGALFFNWARPDRTRLGWYSFEPAAAYRYEVSASEAFGNNSIRLFPFPADPTAWSIPEDRRTAFFHARQQINAEHANQPAPSPTGPPAEEVVNPIVEGLHGMLARARPFERSDLTVGMFRGLERYLWSVVVAERIDAQVAIYSWGDGRRRSRFMRAFEGFLEILMEIGAASQPDNSAVNAIHILYLCACLMMTALGHNVLPRISWSPEYLSSAESLGLVVAGDRIAFEESASGILAQIPKINAELSATSNTYVDLWVYYPRPADEERERRICDLAIRHGGRPTDWCRELPDGHQARHPPFPIYTIIEFSDLDAAKQARLELLERGDAVIVNIMPGIPDD